MQKIIDFVSTWWMVLAAAAVGAWLLFGRKATRPYRRRFFSRFRPRFRRTSRRRY